VNDGSATTTYAYDHTTERVSKTVGTTTTTYANDLYNTDGTTKIKHIFANGELIATIETTGATSTTQYIHSDHLGGTNVVTDNNADVVQVLDYYPYGSLRIDETTSPDISKKFTGHDFDRESDLTYAGARYYDQDIGRWISLDPASRNNPEQFLRDPQQFNYYSYARNNPLGFVDPNGEDIYWYSDGTLAKNTMVGNNQYFETNDVAMLNRNAGIMESNRLRPLYFANLVKTGGEWDFKNNEKYAGREFFFFGGELVQKEEFGNLHYGYVGTAGGYGSDILKDAGGFVQVNQCSTQKCITKWSNMPNNYELPEDSPNIQKGVDLYRTQGNNTSIAISNATNIAYNAAGGQSLSRTLNSLHFALKSLQRALNKLKNET
jgi:RHS repeat-associated protein